MTDAHVGKNDSGQVPDDLMHVHQHPPVVLPVKGDRLDMRVDLGPLLRPIRPDFLMTTRETAFEGFRPGNVGTHRGKGRVNVPRVEGGISGFQELNFFCRRTWHVGFGKGFIPRQNVRPLSSRGGTRAMLNLK